MNQGQIANSSLLLQDDDYLATGHRARVWAKGMADGIIGCRLAGRIAFKIRAPEVRGTPVHAVPPSQEKSEPPLTPIV